MNLVDPIGEAKDVDSFQFFLVPFWAFFAWSVFPKAIFNYSYESNKLNKLRNVITEKSFEDTHIKILDSKAIRPMNRNHYNINSRAILEAFYSGSGGEDIAGISSILVF